MKLLKLEIENINSIYGAQAIDFLADLKEAPLFLICGPTGAGKSTILDAISLALFGVTPRLQAQGRLENRGDVMPELALSRGTAAGKAQLTFRKSSPGEGPQTYRATWRIWRGNKRAPKVDGSLGKPERTLEHWDVATGDWQTLAVAHKTGLENYEAVHAQILEGFTVQDFTRCMLLAQGDFAAFLKATDAERSAILERLTRTEAYQRIGARAADRLREAKLNKDRAQEALGGIGILEPAEVQALEAALAEQEARYGAARDRFQQAQAWIAWLEREGELLDQERAASSRLEEARAALTEAAGERAALAAFEQARPALALLRQAQADRAEAGSRQADLDEILATLATLTEQLRGQEAPLAAARAAVAGARQAVAEREPEIREARLRRGRLKAAEEEAGKATAGHSAARIALARAQEALEQAARALAVEQGRVDGAEQALAGLPYASLAAGLGGLEARISAQARTAVALAADLERRDREAGEILREREATDRLQAAASAALAALATLQGEVDASRRELEGRLEGAETAAQARVRLAQVRDGLDRRRRLLEALAARAGEAQESLDRVRAAEAGQTQAEEAAREGRQAALAAEQARALATARMAATRQELEDRRWTRDLALERNRLQADRPCPLCGASEHPALADPDQAAKDQQVRADCARLDALLAAAEQAWAAAEPGWDQAVRAAAGLDAAAAEAVRRVREAEQEHQRRSERVDAAAREAGQQAGDAPAALQEELAVRFADLETRQGALARAEADFQQAQTNLHAGQRAVDAGKAAADVAAARLAGKRDALAREDLRLAGVQEEQRLARQALEAELAGYGLPLEPVPGLAAARERVGRYQEAGAALQEALGQRDRAAQQAQSASQAQAGAEANARARAQELLDRQAALQAASAEVRAVLDGGDPEPLEAALAAAVTEAEAALQVLEQGHQQVRAAHDRALGSHRALAKERDAAQEALAASETALAAALQPFGTEAALAALDLPPERVQALRERKAALDAAEAAAAHQGLQALAILRSHREHPPEGPQADPTVAGLRAVSAAAQEEQRIHSESAGAARRQLQEQAEAEQRLGRAVADLQEAQREEGLWVRMNDLIGTGAGEAFRKFAQVLNLKDLLVRANVRMEKLRPRYRLVPAKDKHNADRLAFAIEDRDHAGEIGPVTNLSGGETFLVSLCLALALADYRTVRMPIETLLLDEGFGTLDRRTLGDVMGILNALTSASTQVGIISHVEWLQESPLPRIRVEPVGMGRSRIAVEAGSGSVHEGP